MGLFPIVMALLFAPTVFTQFSGQNIIPALRICAFGACFGFGILLFGVSLSRVGLAVANALVNGIVALLGSISPIAMGLVRLDRNGYLLLGIGLFLLLASIVLCGAASVARDNDRESLTGNPAKKSRSLAGVAIACAAGVLSSMLNIGFTLGSPLIEQSKNHGCSPTLATLVVWIPVLIGALIVNIGWTVALIWNRKSWKFFFDSPDCWTRGSLMGFLWFSAIFVYGFGVSVLGPTGVVYGWAGLIVVSILTSNSWGIFTGEWEGASLRSRVKMLISTVLLVIAFAILAVQRPLPAN